MNSKRAKELKSKANELLVQWLKSIVPEGEDRDLITVDNMMNFLPEDTHMYANESVRLYAMTPRYIYKKVKKNPNLTLEELMTDGIS